MKTIIAGSRDLDNLDFLEGLRNCPFLKEVSVVISGTARGADKYGESWAEWKNIPIMRFPANWKPDGIYNPNAGFERNIEMAEVAEAAIIIWNGISRGSMDMYNKVLVKGIPCYIYDTKNNRSYSNYER